MVKRRSNNASGRMDAAIDHFTPMGYSKADIRRTVNMLLKPDMYGKEGWPLLESDCYYAVQEALLDKEQEEKLQLPQEEEELQLLQEEQGEEEELQLLQEEQGEEEELQLSQVEQGEELQLPQEEQGEEEELQLLQEEQGEEEEQQLQQEEEVQQKEAAMQVVPLENNMPIVKVPNEVPAEAVLTVEEIEEVVPMIIDRPAPKAALPLPAATGIGRTRRPCYGWISESESDLDNEEQPASQQHEVHVPSPGGDLLCGRKRRSRWDVR